MLTTPPAISSPSKAMTHRLGIVDRVAEEALAVLVGRLGLVAVVTEAVDECIPDPRRVARDPPAGSRARPAAGRFGTSSSDVTEHLVAARHDRPAAAGKECRGKRVVDPRERGRVLGTWIGQARSHDREAIVEPAEQRRGRVGRSSVRGEDPVPDHDPAALDEVPPEHDAVPADPSIELRDDEVALRIAVHQVLEVSREVGHADARRTSRRVRAAWFAAVRPG